MNNPSITLTTRKQLDIYMNPQRQRLLKTMEIHGMPMTSKQLANILNISPSSVSHHIKKLESLGLLELDHTESIHGIQAKYYRKLPVDVSLGANRDDDLKEERSLLTDYIFSETWKSFKEHLKNTSEIDDFTTTGDSLSGIVHLKPEDAKELLQIIQEFTRSHASAGEDTVPWEYALIAFPHKKINDGKE